MGIIQSDSSTTKMYTLLPLIMSYLIRSIVQRFRDINHHIFSVESLDRRLDHVRAG